MAKWLYEAGAAEDFHRKSVNDYTSLRIASFCKRHSTVLWLVSPRRRQRRNKRPRRRKHPRAQHNYSSPRNPTSPVCQNLAALLDQHLNFTRLVLPATSAAQSADERSASVRYAHRSKPRAPPAPSPLALLCGHEETLLAIIADFVGVVRGRQLRNAQEASTALPEFVRVRLMKARVRAIEKLTNSGLPPR